MKQNPWAGLASYQDPAAGSTLLFCGRDNESYDLAALVDDNIFCTLYGKSGTGKTSLLNAGVFPRLREMGYLPVSIRLGMEAIDTTFQQCVVSRLAQVAEMQTADTVALPADDQDEQWLWAWFARTRFVDGEGKTRFAVLVFDQFEEVFRSRRDEAEALLRQIHFMMDPSHSLGESYDYNFRFLASIREDDLYLLEDSLDRCYLDEMKKCRYRLRPLSHENALSVVLKPGKDVLNASEAQDIAETVIDMARSEQDDSISTNLLSLLCSRLYAKMEHTEAEHITLKMLGEFMRDNPIIQFYNEATAGMKRKERNYIENSMVDSAGRRNSISESDFRLHVNDADRLLEGENKILQRTSVGNNSQDYRIELIHDSFCDPLVEIRERRSSQKVILWAIGVFLLLCLLVGITLKPMNNLRRMDAVQSGYSSLLHASQSELALANGDVDLALRLAIEAVYTSDWGEFDESHTYTTSAEAALRNAMQQHPDFAELFAVQEVSLDTVELFSDNFIKIRENGNILFHASYYIDGVTLFDISRNDSILTIEGDDSIWSNSLIRILKIDTVARILTSANQETSVQSRRLSTTGNGMQTLATYQLNGFCPVEFNVSGAGGFVDIRPLSIYLRDSAGRVLSLPYPPYEYLISMAKEWAKGKTWSYEDSLRYLLMPSVFHDYNNAIIGYQYYL